MLHQKEKEIVEYLLKDEASFGDAVCFCTGPSLAIDDEIRECKLHVALEVPRAEFGLDPNQKPGDIDILIIPEIQGTLHFERSIAIEVKVVRPTHDKPHKNSGKMGATQANGLSNDGFPFVGLLHLEVPEKRVREDCVEMPNGYFMDMFPFESAHRQEGRLKSLNLAESIGYSSTGLYHDNNAFMGSTFGFDKKSRLNNNLSDKLVHSIINSYYSGRLSIKVLKTYG
ncbi:hypothetical protein [Vibrio mimicus]|uniref:hypothetical protein n=1 Tax=Vibrio mimicus TaxID=674 RepID=UPI002FEF9255